VNLHFYVDETQSVITVGYTGPQDTWCPPELNIVNPPAAPFPDLWTQSCSFTDVTLARTSDPVAPWVPMTFSNFGQDVDVWAPLGNFTITSEEAKYCRPGEVNQTNCPYSTFRYTLITVGYIVDEDSQSVYNVFGHFHMPGALAAGTAALMIEANPALRGKPSQIKAQLKAGSTKPSEFYRNPTGGRGFLNVPGALRIPASG
jgi:hypothetical protein